MSGKDGRKVRQRSLPVRIVLMIIKIVLIAIAAVAALVLILVAAYMPRNTKAMERGVNQAVNTISDHAKLTELDAGEYTHLRMFGIMNFTVHQYDVENIGNLSTMTMNAGLMQMSTVILTPLDKDIPLISTDYMYILGNRNSYLECYDLVLDKGEQYQRLLDALRGVKAQYADLDTITPSSAWYDSMRTVGLYMKGKTTDDDREEEALSQWVAVVMDYAEEQPEFSEEEREEKLPVVEEYTNGLVEQGGVSTDLFVKAMGQEKTRDFFGKVLFGTEQ